MTVLCYMSLLLVIIITAIDTFQKECSFPFLIFPNNLDLLTEWNFSSLISKMTFYCVWSKFFRYMSKEHSISIIRSSETSGANCLLCPLIGSHGPVSSSTIANWVKVWLKNPGVDSLKIPSPLSKSST